MDACNPIPDDLPTASAAQTARKSETTCIAAINTQTAQPVIGRRPIKTVGQCGGRTLFACNAQADGASTSHTLVLATAGDGGMGVPIPDGEPL